MSVWGVLDSSPWNHWFCYHRDMFENKHWLPPPLPPPHRCVKINNDDFLDILKNLFTEETLLEFVQWLQTYWYIPAGIIVIVTIVIILLPLTYRKKSRKKLRQGLNTIRRRVSRHGRHVNNTQQVHTGGVGVNRRNSIPRGNAYRPKKLSESELISAHTAKPPSSDHNVLFVY